MRRSGGGWLGGRNKRRRVATFSQVIAGIPHLDALLDIDEVLLQPPVWRALQIDLVVGWGMKESADQALRYARRFRRPYVRIEDGFVRSIGLGVDGHPPCSIVVDDLGIYYDATAESRLEAWLNAASFRPTPDEIARATQCMATIRRERVSKYNHVSTDYDLGPRTGARPRVLVVDQTYGDMSVLLGLVPENGFRTMLSTAIAEHPEADILVKTHPDVVAGKKQGYLGAGEGLERVRFLAEQVNPIALLEQVDAVYVGTSQLGFEALLLDKPVHCFGVPFYAGWGLTHDRVRVPRRRQRRTLAEVFAAAYLKYARYVDPATGRRCELEDLLAYIVSQRRPG